MVMTNLESFTDLSKMNLTSLFSAGKEAFLGEVKGTSREWVGAHRSKDQR